MPKKKEVAKSKQNAVEIKSQLSTEIARFIAEKVDEKVESQTREIESLAKAIAELRAEIYITTDAEFSTNAGQELKGSLEKISAMGEEVALLTRRTDRYRAECEEIGKRSAKAMEKIQKSVDEMEQQVQRCAGEQSENTKNIGTPFSVEHKFQNLKMKLFA